MIETISLSKSTRTNGYRFSPIFLFYFFFCMKDLERVVMSNVCGIESIGKVKLTRVWFCNFFL